MEEERSPEEARRRAGRRDVLREVAWGLSIFGQVGISVAVPLVVCIGGACWLQQRFSLGIWILILGIILGLGTAVDSALRFYAQIMKHVNRRREQKKEGEP